MNYKTINTISTIIIALSIFLVFFAKNMIYVGGMLGMIVGVMIKLAIKDELKEEIVAQKPKGLNTS